MGTRIAAAAASLLLGALLAGCGVTDAEINEAQAVAEAQANPEPTPWEPRPCHSGEIFQTDAVSGTQSLRPDCFDQALVEAIEEFPEPLPPGTDWHFRSINYFDPEENPSLEVPVMMDGAQDVAVAENWLCAWMGSYLQAVDSDDASGQATSMAYLEKYPQLPAIQANHANPGDFVAGVIAPAQAGDPAKMRAFYGSCPRYGQ
ncbi:hypothetical protein ITX31_01060 [Arthrobacter gandavensis]|uniref:hypothetical protein n=1 Tax=Arthrobacter gandavensis TaxID=169960 RepID=UPI00188E7543|nr:hypothetical protein [Arthrobacter gandavensis]MBF4992701.1 hypothetical protein [Arthrobacter gandavensis]